MSPKSKFAASRQIIQNGGDDGDQILSDIGRDIFNHHDQTAVAMRTGVKMIPEKDWIDDLGRELFMVLRDLWRSVRRN